MDNTKNISLHKKLGFQLALPFGMFTVTVFMVLAGGIYYVYSQQTAQTLLIPKTIARATGESISNFFKNLDASLRLAAESTGATLAPNAHDTLVLQNMVKDNSALLELALFDVNGTSIVKIVKPTIGNVTDTSSVAEDQYFKAVISKNDNFISTPLLTIYNTP